MLLIKVTLVEWFTRLSHCNNQICGDPRLESILQNAGKTKKSKLRGFLLNWQNDLYIFTSLEKKNDGALQKLWVMFCSLFLTMVQNADAWQPLFEIWFL